MLPYLDNRKKKSHIPGLHIDKNSIIEPVFPEFHKGYLTVVIHKQFIFTKGKYISPQNIFIFKYKRMNVQPLPCVKPLYKIKFTRKS